MSEKKMRYVVRLEGLKELKNIEKKLRDSGIDVVNPYNLSHDPRILILDVSKELSEQSKDIIRDSLQYEVSIEEEQ